jgi:uncharacterized membrane protein YkoI
VEEDGVYEWAIDARSGVVLGREKKHGAEKAAALRKRMGDLSLAAAVAAFGKHMKGQMIEVEVELDDDERGYEARLVHDGRMTDLTLDEKDGKIGIDDDDDDRDDGDDGDDDDDDDEGDGDDD